MTIVLQRINSAAVRVDERVVSECGRGLLLLVGVKTGDTEEDARLLSEKILKLRVFSDERGKMNLSVKDIGGEVLSVPNFTLLGSYRKGTRPDYKDAAPPEPARNLFDFFCDLISLDVPLGRGVFGADMKIDINADGPVTLCLDSEVLKK